MEVVSAVGKLDKAFCRTLVIGVFDGVHLGHQALIRRAVLKAKKLKGKAFVLTFWPHPVHILHPHVHLPLITPLEYRLRLIKSLGVAKCIIVKFTKQFSKLSPENFVKRYLVRYLAPQEIYVGDDFRFGQNRSGTLDEFELLGRKYGFDVNAVKAIKGGVKKIGSTTIRECIANGRLKHAERLLGRPVAWFGKVVKGEQRGKRLGFPTANLIVGQQVLPPLGVYAVKVIWREQKYCGMANIGYRPTFEANMDVVKIEVHLFDFTDNLYGEEIIVEFVKKVRSEKLYLSYERLIRQLQIDQKKIKKLLSERPF